jgi:gamma-D-glutamyl-L-lysine dipeptidyl-peptidase
MFVLSWYNSGNFNAPSLRRISRITQRQGRKPVSEVSKIVAKGRLIRNKIMTDALSNKGVRVFVLCISLLFVVSCGSGRPVVYGPQPPITDSIPISPPEALAPIGYAIQAGAFSKRQNAAGLTATLKKQGVDAYYFLHETGLYKVRFGDFPSKASAQTYAGNLYARSIIDVYYIVGPEDYPKEQTGPVGEVVLREEIVKTAERFLGIPYQWGGNSPETGFDCSGLTTSVYELNGLKLPRSSRQQWQAGTPIDRNELSKGDLVFFATAGGKRVTHVGIYVDENKFIHAPSKGKTIRFASLSNGYFKRHYLGARTYL